MNLLALLKTGLSRILSKVGSRTLKLGLMPRQVIKGILLPEASGLAKPFVDLSRGEMFPRVALLQKAFLI